MRGFSYAGSDIHIHVRILVQHLTQANPVVRHIQVVAGDEQRVRVLAYSVLKTLHQLPVAVAVRGIHVPVHGIYQTVVRCIHRQVHPVRLGYMDADRHLQLACLADQRLDTRIVDMNILAFYRACIQVTFAFVAQLAYTYSAQLVMIALQQLASLLNTFLAHI